MRRDARQPSLRPSVRREFRMRLPVVKASRIELIRPFAKPLRFNLTCIDARLSDRENGYFQLSKYKFDPFRASGVSAHIRETRGVTRMRGREVKSRWRIRRRSSSSPLNWGIAEGAGQQNPGVHEAPTYLSTTGEMGYAVPLRWNPTVFGAPAHPSKFIWTAVNRSRSTSSLF